MMTPILAAALGLTIAFAAPAAYGWSQTALAAEEEQQPITVSMSAGSGIYAEAFTLTLTSEGAKTIYYTLDGSDPKTSSTRAEYTDGITIKDRSKEANYVSAVDPLLFDNANVRWKKRTKSYTTTRKAPADADVDKGTVVKAVAVDANGNFGTVETNTYFVGTVAMHIKNAQKSAQAAGIPLSVMSISMNYEDLFDYEKGIYVKGKIFDEAVAKYLEENPKATTDMMNDQARRLPANYNQKGKAWERNTDIRFPPYVPYRRNRSSHAWIRAGRAADSRSRRNRGNPLPYACGWFPAPTQVFAASQSSPCSSRTGRQSPTASPPDCTGRTSIRSCAPHDSCRPAILRTPPAGQGSRRTAVSP